MTKRRNKGQFTIKKMKYKMFLKIYTADRNRYFYNQYGR